ncbi:MAG: RNA methyltransferase [Bacteroides sp. SM23_62]|nr:MAG: RNA methyltransferase [Bacteroides sp. SM23_62]
MRKLDNNELNRLSIPEFKKAEKIPVVVVLDNVRSLNNIGSVFRTADAFLVDRILLCGITATPPHKDIHKTALGATESVDWKYYPETGSAIEELKEDDFYIMAVEQTEHSVSLDRFRVKRDVKYAFIFGHEIRGVSQEIVDMSDASLDIPQFGTKHSLNISVCAGMVIWEVFRQLRL